MKLIFYFSLILGLFTVISCDTVRQYNSEHKTASLNYKSKEASSNFLWGINGHPLRPSYTGNQNQYLEFSFQEQIQYLKQLNLNIYRVDVHVDEKGIWNEKPEDLKRLITELKESDIDLLPVIFTNPWRTGDVRTGENWNYQKIKGIVESNRVNEFQNIKELDIWEIYYDLAFRTGRLFAQNYGDDIKYYHVGNEIAYYIIKNYGIIQSGDQEEESKKKNVKYFHKNFGGNEIIHFFQSEEHAKRSIASSAYVAGMIDGIKNINPEAITVVNGTRIDYGYLKLLNMLNTNYDVIGWNWYSSFGNFGTSDNKLGINIYQELSDIGQGKPIWITELNKNLGSYHGERIQSIDLEKQIDEIYRLPNVEAIIVYELIDQDQENPDWAENNFGLLRSPFQFPSSQLHKPAFDVYLFKIQEKQYGIEDFVRAIWTTLNQKKMSHEQFNDFKQRLISYPNKEIWLNELFFESDTETRELIDHKPTSQDDWTSYIQEVYSRILERETSKRELRFWNRKLKKTNSAEILWTDLLLSDEFYENAIWEAYESRTGFKRPIN